MTKTNVFKCDSCGTEFATYFEFTKQGSGCASTAYFDKNKIICGYGSTYDLDVYNFAPEIADWVNSGEICDKCIERLIQNKGIIFNENESFQW